MMKVSAKNYVSFHGGAAEKNSNTEAVNSKPQTETPLKNSSDAISAYGQAAIYHSNNAQLSSKENIKELIELILEDTDYTIFRCFGSNHSSEPYRAKAGDEIPNWKNLYNERLNIACYKDKDNCVDAVYVLDCDNKSINVYDTSGNKIKSYTADEVKALAEYKGHPEAIHDWLRHGRHRSIDSIDTINGYIEKIENCFSDSSKVLTTTEPTVVYRALQSGLSDEDKENLSTVGAVYKDKSFVSTSKSIERAKGFNQKGNPLLEITLPKDSKYLDMDRLFNIDRQHWREQEFLLNKGSEFLITGYDAENNIIKAVYLNK